MKKNIFDEYLKTFKIKYTPEDNPIVEYVVGQAGAGKSVVSNDILKNNDNIAVIDTDVYRKFHPSYEKAIDSYKKTGVLPKDTDFSKDSHQFASTFNSKIRGFCTRNNYSMLFETTPSDPKWLLENAREMRKNGYETNFTIISTHPDVSRQRLLNRYLHEKENDGFGRLVPHNFHDYTLLQYKSLFEGLKEDGITKINLNFNGNLIKDINIHQAEEMFFTNFNRTLRESEVYDLLEMQEYNLKYLKDNIKYIDKKDFNIISAQLKDDYINLEKEIDKIKELEIETIEEVDNLNDR